MAVRAIVVETAVPGDVARARLASAGVGDVTTLAGDDLAEGLAQLADRIAPGRRTVVVSSDLVAATAPLARLVDDPSVRTGLLVQATDGPAHPVRTSYGHVASASSEQHEVVRPDVSSLGAFSVQAGDAEDARRALLEMSVVAREEGWTGDVVDHAVVALVRREVPVVVVSATGPAVRSSDPSAREAVLAALASGDDARALKASGNRADDGLYSTYVLRRLSKPVTELAIRVGMSPNQVSLVSLAVGLLAAVLFAAGSLPLTVLAALLLQASLVIDCVDGEVARRTRTFSDLGAWLDASTDRVKEYAVYAGLAVAASHAGADIWLLASATLVLQTVRHMSDYDFSRVQRVRETWVAPRDLRLRDDGGVVSGGATLDLSRRASGRGWVRWAKKVVHMPIGERWLVISVVSVVAGPRWVFVVLLVLGLVAAAYTTAGRLLRVRRWTQPPQRSGHHLLLPQMDLGPLTDPAWARLGARRPLLAGPMGWSVPAALRLLELGAVLAVSAVVVPERLPWAFALLFVLAYHHYDTLYRALGGGAPPRWLVWGGLGFDGRLVVLLVCAAIGPAAVAGALVVSTVLLAAWFVGIASVQYVSGISAQGPAGSAQS